MVFRALRVIFEQRFPLCLKRSRNVPQKNGPENNVLVVGRLKVFPELVCGEKELGFKAERAAVLRLLFDIVLRFPWRIGSECTQEVREIVNRTRAKPQQAG